MGETDNTIEHNQEILAIKINVYGENHAEVASSYCNIGNVRIKQSDYDTALECYNKSLTV